MIRHLHNLLILYFLGFSVIFQAQDMPKEHSHELLDEAVFLVGSTEVFVKSTQKEKKVYSYECIAAISTTVKLEHEHQHNELSQLDILSFDQAADFNCSGGFCMDRSHFHKKGISYKRQLFDYFIRISC